MNGSKYSTIKTMIPTPIIIIRPVPDYLDTQKIARAFRLGKGSILTWNRVYWLCVVVLAAYIITVAYQRWVM